MRMTDWLLRGSPCLFDFNNTNLRVIELNGQPWFVAADVCRVLGFPLVSSGGHQISVTQYLHRLDASEKKVIKKTGSEGQNFSALFPPAGGYMATLVSESGLYKLVMRSDKPEAKAFQDWVTKVVLPAIRTMPQMPVDFHTVTGEPE